MKHLSAPLIVLALAAAAVAQSTAASQPLRRVELPAAGIAFSIPQPFAPQIVEEPFGLVRYMLMERNEPTQAVSLSAFPVAADATADAFAEQLHQQMQANLAIRHLTLRTATSMPAAGAKASVRLISYTFRGVETVAGRVCFMRPLPRDGQLCYVITIESNPQHQSTLVSLLGQVVQSLTLTAMQPPAATGLPELTKPIKNYPQGVSLRVPLGWHASTTPTGLMLAQTDYSSGGEALPQVTVMAEDVPAGTSAEAAAKKYLELAALAAAQRKVSFEVIKQGPTTLAGQAGWQMTMTETAATTTAPTTLPADAEKPVMIVHRVAVRPAAGQPSARSYSIVMIAQDASAAWADSAMDTLATGFEIIAAPPATVSATPTATTRAAPATPTTAPAAPTTAPLPAMTTAPAPPPPTTPVP